VDGDEHRAGKRQGGEDKPERRKNPSAWKNVFSLSSGKKGKKTFQSKSRVGKGR